MPIDIEGDFTDRWIDDELHTHALIAIGHVCRVFGQVGLTGVALNAIMEVISR